jgi:hypothetical protein
MKKHGQMKLQNKKLRSQKNMSKLFHLAAYMYWEQSVMNLGVLIISFVADLVDKVIQVNPDFIYLCKMTLCVDLTLA